MRIVEFYFNDKQHKNPVNPIQFTTESATIDFQVRIFINLLNLTYYEHIFFRSFISFILCNCMHTEMKNFWFDKMKKGTMTTFIKPWRKIFLVV